MGLLFELRRRARHVIGPLFGAVAVVYFSYHTLHGERGFLAWLQMKDRVRQAERRLAHLQSEKSYWEARVKLLHPASLNRDMLDERVRLMLGYAEADDVVVLEPDERKN